MFMFIILFGTGSRIINSRATYRHTANLSVSPGHYIPAYAFAKWSMNIYICTYYIKPYI